MKLVSGFLSLCTGCSNLPCNVLNSQALKEMGTKDMDFVQLNQLIGRKTGGISIYPFTSSVQGKEHPCTHMVVRGKAMSSRTEDLFNLVKSFSHVGNWRVISVHCCKLCLRMKECLTFGSVHSSFIVRHFLFTKNDQWTCFY